MKQMEILTKPFTDTEAQDCLKKYKEQQDEAVKAAEAAKIAAAAASFDDPGYNFPPLDVYTHQQPSYSSMFDGLDIPDCYDDDPSLIQETRDEMDRLKMYIEHSVQSMQMELACIKGMVKNIRDDQALMRKTIYDLLEYLRKPGEA